MAPPKKTLKKTARKAPKKVAKKASKKAPKTAGKKSKRDIEKNYPTADFAAKLRRLADALESGKRFEIDVAGERISVPVRAAYNIEHERGADEEEIEFQIKWKLKSN